MYSIGFFLVVLLSHHSLGLVENIFFITASLLAYIVKLFVDIKYYTFQLLFLVHVPYGIGSDDEFFQPNSEINRDKLPQERW